MILKCKRIVKFCNQFSHNFSSIADLDNSKVVNENNLDTIRRFLPKGIAEKIKSQKGKIESNQREKRIGCCI
jgi:hypothetical protein